MSKKKKNFNNGQRKVIFSDGCGHSRLIYERLWNIFPITDDIFANF